MMGAQELHFHVWFCFPCFHCAIPAQNVILSCACPSEVEKYTRYIYLFVITPLNPLDHTLMEVDRSSGLIRVMYRTFILRDSKPAAYMTDVIRLPHFGANVYEGTTEWL